MLEDGTCCQNTTPDPKCQYNSYFDGVKCVCNEGFFELYEGVCATCPPRQTWNGKKCSYDPACWVGYVWSEERECCVKSS